MFSVKENIRCFENQRYWCKFSPATWMLEDLFFQRFASKLELMLPTFLFSDSQRRLTRWCVLQDQNRPTRVPRVHCTCVPDKYLIMCCSQTAMMYKHCDFDGFPSAFPFLDWCVVENTSFYCCWQQGNSGNKWTIARHFENQQRLLYKKEKEKYICIQPDFVYIFHKFWAGSWCETGGFLNETWQVPINHPKSWIDNKCTLNYE